MENDKSQIKKNTVEIVRKGVQGIALKRFEEVVADILTHSSSSSSSSAAATTHPSYINSDVLPCYLPLPTLPNKDKLDLISSAILQSTSSSFEPQTTQTSKNSETEDTSTALPPPTWPFTILPPAVTVRCTSTTQNDRDRKLKGLLSGNRAIRKEQQLRSLIQCVLAMLPSSAFGALEEKEEVVMTEEESSTAAEEQMKETKEKKIRIIDFAGGTGHLALPLSLLLPKCEIVLVDLKAASLEFMHQKAEDLGKNPTLSPKSQNTIDNNSTTTDGNVYDDDDDDDKRKEKKNNNKKRRIKPAFISNGAVDVTSHANTKRQCQYIPNLYTFHGSISNYIQYDDDFDIGIALHACGEATDHVLRACGRVAANFIVSPCCVGKLGRQTLNPYIYHATAMNEPTISYPQSSVFRTSIVSRTSTSTSTCTCEDKFDILAKAADYSDMQDMRTCRNASRRTAKSLLEMDRLLFMKETYHYDQIVLSRMDPWEASPKNDILMGWMLNHNNERKITKSDKKQRSVPLLDPYSDSHGGVGNVQPCSDCNADITITINNLVSPPNCDTVPHVQGNICSEVSDTSSSKPSIASSNKKLVTGDTADWTKGEEESITKILQEFVQSTDNAETEKRFPKGMGSRKRKLVHYLAVKMDLRHWGEGKKGSEKIVVVAKRSKRACG